MCNTCNSQNYLIHDFFQNRTDFKMHGIIDLIITENNRALQTTQFQSFKYFRTSQTHTETCALLLRDAEQIKICVLKHQTYNILCLNNHRLQLKIRECAHHTLYVIFSKICRMAMTFCKQAKVVQCSSLQMYFTGILCRY